MPSRPVTTSAKVWQPSSPAAFRIPQFESQTKIKLTTSEVEGAVNSIVGDGLAKYFEENPATARLIAQKGCEQLKPAKRPSVPAIWPATRTRSPARSAEKLRDCRNHDLNVSELYLVEGDSAGGSADTGRDSANQAILPLRGKIINVEKAQLVKVLANAEVAALFKAIGIAPMAEEIDIQKRRYGKIVLMTDADVDGSPHPHAAADVPVPAYAGAGQPGLRLCRSAAALPCLAQESPQSDAALCADTRRDDGRTAGLGSKGPSSSSSRGRI